MIGENNKIISIIGGFPCSDEEARMDEIAGRELAVKRAILICGGEGGVMEAACKGAVSAGGLTIGILPGNSRKQANPFVSIPIITGIGSARNYIVAKSAQAVIAIGGGYGTLSEICFALKNGIPVIGLNTWKFGRNDKYDESIIYADRPEDAVRLALEMID